jgi:flagellar biosynthesis anti-sigma factor FlgM
MTINNNISSQSQISQTYQDQAVSSVGHGSSKGSSGSANSADHVTLSGDAGLVSQALNAQSPERANRVQALAQQYAAGQYKVDTGKLADALISHATRG